MNATINKQLPFVKGFILTVSFSFILVLIRVIKTESILFIFLIWNLFLACIPYAVTLLLSLKKVNHFIFWMCFGIWLAFLPNSPYILTDLQHIRTSTLSSVWFDVLLILSFAINGLVIGFASLSMMQELLRERFSKTITDLMIHLILILCGFGIYLGRVLRWNSWDIIQDPMGIISDIAKRIIFPTQYVNTWAFTLGFGIFLITTYRTMQSYHRKKE